MAFSLVLSIFLLSSLCNAASAVIHTTCKTTEREALLHFKRSKVVYSRDAAFSSWVGSDCCRNWTGVACDNRTGHVINLRVYDEGMMPVVPPQIGNLTHLESLAIVGFRIEGGWIARLTSLKFLSLLMTDLQRAPDFIENLSTLPSISEVAMYNSSVLIPQSLQHVNFTCLSSLKIERNSPSTNMPHWLFNITSLTYLSMMHSNVFGSIPSAIGNLYNLKTLDLRSNELSGLIPASLGGLHHISFLDLSRNKLTGNIPSSLGNLTSLTGLFLSYNELNGPMPEFIADFTNLEELFMKGNNLQGALTENYFNNLKRLSGLSLPGNPLEIRFSLDWNPPFQLETLNMGFCNLLGSSFPRWIRTQSVLRSLNLSNLNIFGFLPTWIWDLSRIEEMDLSGNHLSGSFPTKLLDMPRLRSLSLADNQIEGPLPQFKNPNNLQWLFLSNNSLSGRIPISYCELKWLDILDLSENHLSGMIPRCLQKLQSLSILNLARNNLDGSIDGIFRYSSYLEIVALNDNNFSGDFPSSLRSCSRLRVLNIGQNTFSGNLPSWIATSAPLLSVLIVRSNKFYGEIAQELHLLKNLKILDLSDNKFSGSIPHGFWNFSGMKEPYIGSATYTYRLFFVYSADIITKGKMMKYSRIVLELMVFIDLSSNELTGEIPREVNDLLGLKSLNLSRNHMTGNIPDNIGALKNVESLDLSFNNFQGKIPESMLCMAFLATLNLSYNNLTGRIPSGSQFSTFNSSSYIGNSGLCGTPLLKLCDGGGNPKEVPNNKTNEMHEDRKNQVFLFSSVALGFIFGFWTLYGILWLKRTWRYVYFNIIDSMLDKIYQATKKGDSHSIGNDNYT